MTWPTVTLADVAQGGLFTDGDWVESKDQDPGGGVRLTQLADVGVAEFRNRSDRWLREDQASRLNCTFLEPRDLLIARMPDPIGRACLAPSSIGRAVTAVDIAVLRIGRDDVLPEYAMWAINSPDFRSRVEALQSGTTRKRISRKNLASLTILVPPLKEQRRIVDILEDHLSRLEAGADGLDTAMTRARRLGASALASMLYNAKVHPDAVTTTIGALAEVGTGATPSKSNPEFYEDGQVPWVTSGDLSQGVIRRATQFVTQKALQTTSLKLNPAGTLLVAMYGEGKTRGTVAELAIAATTNQACASVQLHDPELRPWIRAALEANYRTMRRLASGGVQPNLNLSLVRSIELPLPPTRVRRDLLAELSATQERLRLLSPELDGLRRRSDALRRALLAAAFSGRLTGRPTDDEVIEELADAN